jgi:hypothetical protein
MEPTKAQHLIEATAQVLKFTVLPVKSDRVHCGLNECQDIICATVLHLARTERFKKPVPLGHARHGIIDAAPAQQPSDFGASQPCRRVTQDSTNGFQLSVLDLGNRHHNPDISTFSTFLKTPEYYPGMPPTGHHRNSFVTRCDNIFAFDRRDRSIGEMMPRVVQSAYNLPSMTRKMPPCDPDVHTHRSISIRKASNCTHLVRRQYEWDKH